MMQTNYLACKARAKKMIQERLKLYNQHYNFSFVRISIKDMRSRWGSCSQKGNLNFHYKLMFLPEELMDYVVVHELCHLQEMNHSKKFWRLVSQTIPHYRSRVLALRRLERGMIREFRGQPWPQESEL